MRDSRKRGRAEYQARRILSNRPEEFAIFIKKELEPHQRIAKAADLKPE
jgi:hypothetical protein